jgi:hypothetical protein
MLIFLIIWSLILELDLGNCSPFDLESLGSMALPDLKERAVYIW